MPVTTSTADRAAMLAAVSAVVSAEVEPRAQEIDRTAVFPRDLYRRFGELGLFGSYVPQEYGGVDVDLATTLLAIERIARSSAALALSIGNCGDAVAPIVAGGSAEARAEVLPRVAAGEVIPCFALTEPGAGSDAAGLATKARRVGDTYFLTGQKIYITNGSAGDYFTVFARTGGDGTDGVTAFLLRRDNAGLSIGRDEELLGLRGMPATVLSFDEAPVSQKWRLGAEGEGFPLAMSALDEARLNISAVALGVARRALDDALKHARERHAFGRPIIEHQGLGFLLADLGTELAGAWSLFRTAVRAIEAGRSRAASATASMAKLACTRAASRIADEAVQVFGGAGLTKDYPVERLYRDVKAFQILDGTTQIQQWIVARYLARQDFPFSEIEW